jgi:predicted ArsR family transcriptional regulator
MRNKVSESKSGEFKNFDQAMSKILKADPEAVKAAMEAEKRERELQAEKTGKRGRGRPPKHAASAPASSEKD